MALDSTAKQVTLNCFSKSGIPEDKQAITFDGGYLFKENGKDENATDEYDNVAPDHPKANEQLEVKEAIHNY